MSQSVADRASRLQSRRHESGSRKRKLRELYLITTDPEPVPQVKIFETDQTPSAIEARILEESDLSKGRTFKEDVLPRRSLRSNAARRVNGTPAIDSDSREDAGDTPARKGRGSTPRTDLLPAKATTPRRGRSATRDAKVDATVDAQMKDASASPTTNGETAMEVDRIMNGVESRPGSPGVDPQKTLPISPDEARAEQAAKNAENGHHRAATIHLPPKEVMEGRRSQPLPHAHDKAVNGDHAPVKLMTDAAATEAASSPGSTIDAHSATTPAMHDASTDTSPENEGPRYPERPDEKEAYTRRTPDRDSRSGPKETRDVLASSPTTADAQLRLEEQQAKAHSRELDRQDGELEDDEDEVVGVPTPDDAAPKSADEIAETDASSQDTQDRMDTDAKASKAQPNITHTPDVDATARHKSVSDILSEIPRPNTPTPDRASTQKSVESDLELGSQTPSTPQSVSRIKSLFERAKDKHKSKLSTVVFSKTPQKRAADGTVVHVAKHQPKEPVDYLMPLFVTQSKAMPPLEALLASAHKTITTSNAYVPINESQTCRILKRIYHLQSMDKWSLRQAKRAPEPTRPISHWDIMLKEMKWMRTDFREERKWKLAVARNLAYACAEFVAADKETRKLLQVNATIKSTLPPKEETDADGDADMIHPKTEREDSPVMDFEQTPLWETVAPAEIFSLSAEDVVFGLEKSATADRLLGELPMYSAPLSLPDSELPNPANDPDKYWRRPALTLNKFVEGRIELSQEGPPRKRSRFDYENEDDDEDLVIFDNASQKPVLPAEKADVALFQPENKHIRDRIHWGHQFRPPSEHPMPQQVFFETRSSSQWTWTEDDELKTLVREYSYNWSLISSILSTRSLFASGAERRTPWECFERWVSLEGLPADMQKTHYFRLYNNRMEAAQRNLLAQSQAAQTSAGNAVAPMRRRSTASIRVERRRQSKHLSLVDAMRKLAKKRETTAQKQQHAAGLAAMRKANEVDKPRPPSHTPQEFSRLKHDREVAMQERMLAFQQQRQEAQRRNLLQHRQQQAQNLAQQSRTPGLPNGTTTATANGPVPNPNAIAAPHSRANVPGQPGTSQPQVPSNVPGNAQMPVKGLPQGIMQNMSAMQGLQGQHRLPNNADINMVLQAQRISAQQRQAVQMQSQIQGPQARASPPNMRGATGINQQALMQNNQMMAAFNNASGAAGPAAAATNTPRVGHQGVPAGVATHAQIANLEAQLRNKYPNATPEQIRRMVTEMVTKSIQAQRQQLSQSAMHAAAGGASAALAGQTLPAGIHQSPQLYAQMLRQQQAQQAQRQAAANQAQQSPQVGTPVPQTATSQGSPSIASQKQSSQPPQTPQLGQAQPHARSESVGSGVGKQS